MRSDLTWSHDNGDARVAQEQFWLFHGKALPTKMDLASKKEKGIGKQPKGHPPRGKLKSKSSAEFCYKF